MRRWCVPNVQWSQLVLCATVLFLLGGLHIYRGPNGGPLQALDEVADDEDTSGSVRTTQDDRAYRRLRFPKTSRRLPQVCAKNKNKLKIQYLRENDKNNINNTIVYCRYRHRVLSPRVTVFRRTQSSSLFEIIIIFWNLIGYRLVGI